MKRKDRLFSRSRKNESSPSPEAPVMEKLSAAGESVPAAETVVVGRALHFVGAPEPMPLVDDQLFLSAPPQGGLIISPECVGTPLLVIWKSGEDWLVRRLCQEKLLYNGFETMGDTPILLQDGARMELLGVSAFVFLELREPVTKEPPAAEEMAAMPALVLETVPAAEPEAAVEPIPATEPAPVEEAPFDWTPFLPADEPEATAEPLPETDPVVTTEPLPETDPVVTTEPLPETDPVVTTELIPETEPAVIAEPIPATEPAPVEGAPFDWTPFLSTDGSDPEGKTVLADAPELIETFVPAVEPAPAEEAPFDWTPFLPADEPEVAAEPIPATEPAVIEEAPFEWKPFLPVDGPETAEVPAPPAEPAYVWEPVPMAEPEAVEVPVEEAPFLPEPEAADETLVSALERLAAGDRSALQRLPQLLEQAELYCWGGFNFLGIYLQPIPAVRPGDWSGDADSLDALGWEPRPGMVIPVFTREEEAVKRDCPLGAFPSCSAPGLFARFAEMGLDLEVDPFSDRPVVIPAAAVRDLNEVLGGGVEKIRWIRRTLPW